MPSEGDSDPSNSTLLALQAKIDEALAHHLRSPVLPPPLHTAPLAQLLDHRRELVLSLPSFWLTALLSHPALTLLISASDTQILSHLLDIELQHPSSTTNNSHSHPHDFSLVFTFATNPFFSANTLIKSYSHSDKHGRVVGTPPIPWRTHDPPPLLRDASFLRWISADTHDSAHLGELIRDVIFPHAIALYFGTFPPLVCDEHDDLTAFISTTPSTSH